MTEASSDVGLQLERTCLAWRRTALTMGACAFLQFREAITGHSPILFGHAFFLTFAAAILIVCGSLRMHQIERSASYRPGLFVVKVTYICSLIGAVAGGLSLTFSFK